MELLNNTVHWTTFDKDRYHQHREMEQWCHDIIGVGGWTYDTPVTWEGFGDKIWIMHSMFGRTTFAFKESKHLSWFLLRWSS